ncbi:MAG: 4Fe-4S binding protein [Desulfomonile tiedjei]|nr:4Fe-4S binding protein [Desulfomonile tiedjei]
MKTKRNIIQIDEELCDGCGNCIVSCAEGALEIVDGKAKLVAEKYCDGLGACLGECPTGALKVIERDADDFDEEAVEHHLEATKKAEAPAEPAMACGCPSAQIRTFDAPTPCQRANEPVAQTSAQSALRHWPVQIRLVPPNAPFLKNADLLVAADCTPIAYPDFHRDFLEGKVVMVGCPKFDDAQGYIEKFAGIFTHASIKSVTVVAMEVPCCGGLPMIVRRGMQLAGKNIPMEQIIISTQGEVLRKEKLVA